MSPRPTDHIQLDDKSDRDILVILVTQMNQLCSSVAARDQLIDERLHAGYKRFEKVEERVTRLDERWRLLQKADGDDSGAGLARIGMTKRQALSWSGLLICLGSIAGGIMSFVVERISIRPPP